MSLWAINKELYEHSLKENKTEKEAIDSAKCFSLNIISSKKKIFDNNQTLLPTYKSFLGFNRITRKVLIEQEWTFVKDYERKDGIVVRPFFTPSHKGIKYQTYNPNSYDDCHKVAQDILLAQFLEGSLKINFFGLNIPINLFQYKKQDDVEDYLEVTKNFDELPSSLFHKQTRRADMLIEFENWNEKFGKGIAIEIANTEQEKSLKEKENDWNKAHYSYIMLDISNFNLNDESLRNDTILKVNAAFDFHQHTLIEEIEGYWINNKEEIDNIKEDVNNFKNNIRTISEENIQKIETDINNFQIRIKSIDEYKEGLNKVLLEFENKKEEIIKSALNKISVNINQELNDIKNEILLSLKNNISYDILSEIYDKINLTTNFKNKFDKELFNSCEEKRNRCFNIIKNKSENLFEEFKKDMVKIKDGPDKIN